MAPCKYGDCESRKRPSHELFTSPIAYGSKLGKYTGTINRQTALERQGYAMTTRFDNAIKEKKGLIAFIQRRELLRGNSGYYQAQIQNLQEKIKELEASRDAITKRLDAQNELITNNAGKMIPAAIFGPAGIPSNTPVSPPGIVGPAPEETPLPDETPEGSATTEESETESEEPEDVSEKRLTVFGWLLSENKTGQDENDIQNKVQNMSDEELDSVIAQLTPDQQNAEKQRAQALGIVFT